MSFKGKTYPGSLFLQVPVHHYAADFTTKEYGKFTEGTALLNVHAGYNTARYTRGYQLNRNKGKCLRARAVGVEPAPHSKMRVYVGRITIKYIRQIERGAILS